MKSQCRPLLYAVTAIGFLVGCAPTQPHLDSRTVQETVQKDLAEIYQNDAVDAELKLEDILARALKYNLDTKVAALDELIAADDVDLQMLTALPTVQAELQRVGRNNRGGSSSLSLLTGQQSLQPSISSEQYRNVAKLSADWNLLDAGINLWRSKSSVDRLLVAQERRRKIYHNVIQDAYSAYWRAVVAQKAIPDIEILMTDVAEQIDNLEAQMDLGVVSIAQSQTSIRALRQSRQQLMNMMQSMVLAEVELKTLIDYPLDKPIFLHEEGTAWLEKGSIPQINGDISQFEATAFMMRPEIREEVLNKQISMRDIKLSLLETIPGFDLILTYNYDSNKFLAYNNWFDGIAGLTQSINKIITAPARYDRAKNLDLLADSRRQALLAAVITQVHVAKARYDFLQKAYGETEKINTTSQDILTRVSNFKDVGLTSRADYLTAVIDAKMSEVSRAFAFTDVQDAYGRFVTTVGVDLWDAGDIDMSVPDFARQIRENLSNDSLFLLDEPQNVAGVYQ